MPKSIWMPINDKEAFILGLNPFFQEEPTADDLIKLLDQAGFNTDEMWIEEFDDRLISVEDKNFSTMAYYEEFAKALKNISEPMDFWKNLHESGRNVMMKYDKSAYSFSSESNLPLVTEQDIRKVHETGKKNPDKFWSWHTGVLDQAFQLGQEGYELGPVVNCERFGEPPFSGTSFNYQDQRREKGVSVISADDDSAGSAGANLFMSDREIFSFQGILIEGARGSDGEPLVLPINIYENFDR